jgi:hypothetical protein
MTPCRCAPQSRFDSIDSNLQSSVENQSAARGQIMDVDFAAESADMSPPLGPAALPLGARSRAAARADQAAPAA